MATVGKGVYATAVHEFFEGIRTYDLDRATSVLASDADLESPWNEGTVTGKDAIRGVLEGLLGDAAKRPSFTIVDIDGDGSVTDMKVSISGRFGHAAQLHRFRVLHLKGTIHHVQIRPVK